MSWFSKIETWFEKVLPEAATAEKVASATLTVAAPLLETVVGLAAGGPAEAVVTDIVSQVLSDMAAVAALISASGPKPTIISILNAILANLKTLLASADVKNLAKASTITETVTVVIGEIEAILKVF